LDNDGRRAEELLTDQSCIAGLAEEEGRLGEPAWKVCVGPGAARRDLRAVLDSTLAAPPLNCAGVTAATGKIGEACKACHQDFRG